MATGPQSVNGPLMPRLSADLASLTRGTTTVRRRWLVLGLAAIFVGSPAVAVGTTIVYLHLNASNTASATTTVSGVLGGPILQLTNTSTGSTAGALGAYGRSATSGAIVATNAGGGPALQLNVSSGKAPLTVNSTTKVANLNADWLDGIDSTGFIRGPVSGWHEIGAAGEPAFGNYQGTIVWQNYGAPYNTAAFYKDPLGIVRLKGLVKSLANTTSAGVVCDGAITDIFTLPAGYRPAATVIATTLHNDQLQRVDVQGSGTVSLCVPATREVTDWISIDGITFRAAK